MPSNDSPMAISLGDLMRESASNVDIEKAPLGARVLDTLILQGDAVIIRGKDSDATSCVATCLALMMAGGWKRSGRIGAEKHGTLYLDGHHSVQEVRRRLAGFVPHRDPLTSSVQKRLQFLLPAALPELLSCWLDEQQGQQVVERALHETESHPVWKGESPPLVLVIDNLGAWLSDAGTHAASVRKFLHWVMQLRGRGVTFLLVDSASSRSPVAGMGLMDGISNLVIDVTKLGASKSAEPESGIKVQLEMRQQFRDKRPALERNTYRLEVPAKAEGQKRFVFEPHQAEIRKALSDEKAHEAHRLHWGEGKSLRDLAKRFDVPIRTLRAAFKDKNLEVRNRGRKPAATTASKYGRPKVTKGSPSKPKQNRAQAKSSGEESEAW